MRRQVAPRSGQKQARPWLVSTAPEEIGQQVWERVCDERELRQVLAEEAELDAEIAAARPWTDSWWRALRRLDRVRGQRIRLEAKLEGRT